MGQIDNYERVHELTTFLAEWTRKDEMATNIAKIVTVVTTDNWEEIESLSWEDIVGDIGLEMAKLFEFTNFEEM
jgi:hypothetical protein